MKQRLCVLLLLALLLTGCAGKQADPEPVRYEATFLDIFDTATTIIGYAAEEESFRQTAQQIHDELLYYHRLYDIYNEYEGMNNLKTVNDNAAAAPVTVEREIIELLLFCREIEEATGGMVNAAMGSVLQLWHEARSTALNGGTATVPATETLHRAAEHTSMDAIVIDEEASTVYFADSELRLDVGAVAKGYAVARVCEQAPEGLLLSVGGNVCATGAKNDGSSWVVGVQDPEGNGNLHTLYTDTGSVVTSGDYQRYFTVDGVRYHHIIDPATLMPGDKWRSVTVLCADSGRADALSTALFLLTREEGTALLKHFDAEAMWLGADGSEYFSEGFSRRLRS